MIAARITQIFLLSVLSLLRPNAAETDPPNAFTNPSPSLIVVVGAPGQEEYEAPFYESAERSVDAGHAAGAKTILIGSPSEAEISSTDYEKLKHALESEPKESSEDLWLILIGHGTYDGKESKFNLRGPDVTAVEFAEWLRPFQRTVVVVNCASSSGPFVNKLSANGRVIVTATKSGYEQNLTRFAKFFSEAIQDQNADLDKDGQVSVLEAFLIASNRVAEFYSTAGRLATEHALLEDNGDGKGTPADWFRGIRAVKESQDSATPDGFRAHQLHLIRSPLELQLPPTVRARRDQLELEIAKLRDSKSKLSETEYLQKLEPFLLEIAVLYRENEGDPNQ